MIFKNRREAGERLSQALLGYRGRRPLVLAVPRGGVVVAAPIVEALEGELDLIIPRKVGIPVNPELAAAAVMPDGTVIYNTEFMEALGIKPADLQRLIWREINEIKRRMEAYRGGASMPDINGRVVIIVDDGIATGLTIEAALRAVRKEKPGILVLAVPVAPPDTAARLRGLVDDLICLATPEPFYAVGQFYEDFGEVSDEEVKEIYSRYRPV